MSAKGKIVAAAIGAEMVVGGAAVANAVTSDEIINETNQAREAAGLKSVAQDQEKSQDSANWSRNMHDTKNFDHSGDPDVSENIFFTDNEDVTAEEIVQAWLDSPGHRANLLDADADSIGVGVHEGENGVYVTQQFEDDVQ